MSEAFLAVGTIAVLFAVVYAARFIPWREDSTDGSNTD